MSFTTDFETWKSALTETDDTNLLSMQDSDLFINNCPKNVIVTKNLKSVWFTEPFNWGWISSQSFDTPFDLINAALKYCEKRKNLLETIREIKND